MATVIWKVSLLDVPFVEHVKNHTEVIQIFVIFVLDFRLNLNFSDLVIRYFESVKNRLEILFIRLL